MSIILLSLVLVALATVVVSQITYLASRDTIPSYLDPIVDDLDLGFLSTADLATIDRRDGGYLTRLKSEVARIDAERTGSYGVQLVAKKGVTKAQVCLAVVNVWTNEEVGRYQLSDVMMDEPTLGPWVDSLRPQATLFAPGVIEKGGRDVQH